MSKDLILVIDMQNVYADGGAWCCPDFEKAADRIKSLVDRAGDAADIIFTRFISDENPSGTWKQYNIDNADVNADEYGNEITDILKEEAGKYPVFEKSRYSSLVIPEVREAALAADRVVLAGVVAECCVLFTATALIDEGVSVIYLTDAVAGINEETQKATELMFEGLEPLHIRRMTVNEYIGGLQSSS